MDPHKFHPSLSAGASRTVSPQAPRCARTEKLSKNSVGDARQRSGQVFKSATLATGAKGSKPQGSKWREGGFLDAGPGLNMAGDNEAGARSTHRLGTNPLCLQRNFSLRRVGPDFHGESGFSRKPAWRNGRRNGLKIRYSEMSVRVRVPPPASHFKPLLIRAYLSEGTTMPRRMMFWQVTKTINVGRAVMMREAYTTGGPTCARS